jgi:ABC-type glycerol-3-phosphate transport system substrate-binding protein
MYQLGPNPGVMFGAHVMVVPTNTSGDKLTAVKKMLTWISNHDDQWAASGQVPARISIRDGLDLKSYPSNVTIGKSFQAFGHMEVPSDKSLDIGTAEDPEIDAALAGQKTPQQALDDAAKRIQAILDRQ